MYDLICPACKHVVELPFARIGAQAVCRGCAHRFTVQKETVKRKVAIPDDTGNDGDNPLLLGQPATKPPPPARAAGAAASATEPRPAAAAAEDAAPDAPPKPQTDPDLKPIQPVVAHQEPSPDVQRLIARHRARRQRRQRIMIAVISGVTLVALMIGYFVFSSYTRNQSDSSVAGGDDNQPLEELALEGTVINSNRTPASFWEEVDDDADAEVEPPDSPATIRGGELEAGADGRVMFTGEVEVAGYRIIEEATLSVMLIDDADRMYARYRTPLHLLSPSSRDARRAVRIAVPSGLVRRADRVMTHIDVEKEMPGGTMFDKVVYEPVGGGSYAAVKVQAFNPTAGSMNRAVFHITAYNAAGVPAARWTVQWHKPIGGRQRVEFAALTPVKAEWQVASWDVIGAGVTADAPRHDDVTATDLR